MTAEPATDPAAAALEVRQRVAEARQVLIDYEYAANLYLRMKTASISWSTHADKLATRLRSLLKAIEECERVVRAMSP